jgi:uncharacterized protein (DUF924 family)
MSERGIGHLDEVLDNLGVFRAAAEELVLPCPSGFRRIPISQGMEFYFSIQALGPNQIAFAHTHPDSEEWTVVLTGRGEARIHGPVPLEPGSIVGRAAAHPHGRLALIVVLDQFPRSLWRDTPRAFAQDERALALAMEGYANGHYDALETPLYKTVYNLPLVHCEGPDHLHRLDLSIELQRAVLATAPEHLRPGYEFALEQSVEVRKVISAFGRHPHRNAALGRPSTPEEEPYIAAGLFPHLRRPGQK